jgi:general secretion pathway protein E
MNFDLDTAEAAGSDVGMGLVPVVEAPLPKEFGGTPPRRRHRLGEYFLMKGLITPEILDAASREQEVTGDRIGQILVANGFLRDKDRVEGILEVSSERIAQEKVSKSRIPADILDAENILISAETDEVLYVSTPNDERQVRYQIERYYPEKKIQFVSYLPTEMNSFISQMKRTSDIDDAAGSPETMLDRILYRALDEGASDIHVEPRRKSYTAMFRIDGVRRIVHEGPLDEFQTMTAQIKDRSKMDLAERRRPQDGGFQFEHLGKLIDMRVATVPVSDGEKCVLRVLDPDRVQPNLVDLGITRADLWKKGTSHQTGLCLICGPTGSGKTTTLNATIKEMARFQKAIYTVEDPVEYRIPYVGQVSVNQAVGLDFAYATRNFMRADPDIIVLGEVRDEETARNAIKAADTGHLVLATLHTGSIEGSVSRLRDLGVEPKELRYLLRAVLVQTLVRKVCPECGGARCESCGDGYSGRSVVSECEYFAGPEDVDRVILDRDSDVKRTWKTMGEDAVDKMRAGITDLRELDRVFGAGVSRYLEEE